MTTQHTPGPWKVSYQDKNGQSVVAAEHIEIATCWHHCIGSIEKEMQANARLIAAAPSLFEALQEMRRAIGDHFAPNDCYATGPLTGNHFRDLVQCPACSAIALFDKVMATVEGDQT